MKLTQILLATAIAASALGAAPSFADTKCPTANCHAPTKPVLTDGPVLEGGKKGTLEPAGCTGWACKPPPPPPPPPGGGKKFQSKQGMEAFDVGARVMRRQ